MNRTRFLTILLTLTLCASLLPGGALAKAGSAEIPCEPMAETADYDRLFAGYAHQLFYGKEQASPLAVGDRTAGSRLTGNEKLAYDALVPLIKDIAAGERTSTTITLGMPWDHSPVDAEVVFSNSIGSIDLTALMGALTTDFPYEMYWYNKTVRWFASIWGTSGRWQLTLPLPVAEGYRGSTVTTIDADKASRAVDSAANAKAIVAANADKSDYEKLIAYRDAICDAVSYDYEAAANSGTPYGDPWQLVYVFDNDEDTNVVCEGYSKAFQYLCDMSDFSRGTSCYTVTGLMEGGNHMWNIVTMDDGKHYLVDITNSDEGTIGSGGGLFLAGGTADEREYRVTYSDGSSGIITLSGYTLTIEGRSARKVFYAYDSYTTVLWGEGAESILNLAETEYVYQPDLSHSHSYGEPVFHWSEDYSACTVSITCTGSCGEEDEGHELTAQCAVTCDSSDSRMTFTAAATLNGQDVSSTLTIQAEVIDGAVTITLPQTSGHMTVLIVNYDEDGRMVGCQLETATEQTIRAAADGSTVKVFFLSDSTCIPLLAALLVK